VTGSRELVVLAGLVAAGAAAGAATMVAGPIGIILAFLVTGIVTRRPSRAVRLGVFWAALAWTIAAITGSVVGRMPSCGASNAGECYAGVTVPVMVAAAVAGTAAVLLTVESVRIGRRRKR
jgi:hypothetical protein